MGLLRPSCFGGRRGAEYHHQCSLGFSQNIVSARTFVVLHHFEPWTRPESV